MSSEDNLSSEEGFSSVGGSLTDQDWTTTLDQTLEHSSVTEPDYVESGPEVSVALPPNRSSERSVNEVALTGSAALDALDQVENPRTHVHNATINHIIYLHVK